MTRTSWLAGPDGIAHLVVNARSTACGVPPVALRWAWPTRERCPACATTTCVVVVPHVPVELADDPEPAA